MVCVEGQGVMKNEEDEDDDDGDKKREMRMEMKNEESTIRTGQKIQRGDTELT